MIEDLKWIVRNTPVPLVMLYLVEGALLLALVAVLLIKAPVTTLIAVGSAGALWVVAKVIKAWASR
jgi:hypothetical protein